MVTSIKDKFVIYNGHENQYTFTVKKPNSTEAVTFSGGDTITCELYKLDNGTFVGADSITMTGTNTYDTMPGGTPGINIVGTNFGTFTIRITLTDLEGEVGDKSDGYPMRPSHRLVMRINTSQTGQFTTEIDEVYVRKG